MATSKLRIVHCFRLPVGGIFRHVRDLIDSQTAEGHEVGILCDSITGGAFEERLIADVAQKTVLGVHRVPMRRAIVPSDIVDLWRMYALIRDLKPDIVHGHGAKGGAYARLAGSAMRVSGAKTARLYTPHGGSMHYDPWTLGGALFFGLERILERHTDHLLFVSEYEAAAYEAKVGRPKVASRVVHNGLSPGEFQPVEVSPFAADFLYLGMLRASKGPDIFIDALARLADANVGARSPSAAIVGAGDQKQALMQQAERLVPGLVKFRDPMPARDAFALGRVMVLPSRADSLPYAILEALAAGRPVVAVDVGGVREIVPPDLQPLVPREDIDALAAAMAVHLGQTFPPDEALIRHVRSRFSLSKMSEDTMAAYRRVLDGPRQPTPLPKEKSGRPQPVKPAPPTPIRRRLNEP